MDTISFIGVGDIMLGTNFPSVKNLPPVGINLLEPVSSILKSADITFGNLEGCILDSGGIVKKCSDSSICYAFRQPEYLISNLKNAGFDLLSIANNHIYDFGDDGVNNTVNVLSKNKFCFAGIESRPYDTRKINNLKIGFTAFAPNPGALSIIDYESAKRIINFLDSTCDIVVVSFHGGAEGSKHSHITRNYEEFYEENRGNVYEFAHNVIDYGADIVFGHGPHVTRAIEIYKNRFIAYSLGNFCTYDRFNLSGICGIAPIVKIKTLKTGEFVSGEIISIAQKGRGGPVIDKNNAALKEIIKLTNEDFPENNLLFDSNKFKIKK
jgi:poly-gamma-glutamate capsule biosynthesis protein CapA/YwtB (metallophosphatase superfamily)